VRERDRDALTEEGSVSSGDSHLLQSGADLRTIQILRRHRDLEETTIYLHLSNKHLSATTSPLDMLFSDHTVSNHTQRLTGTSAVVGPYIT
jgi:hypothetical protein